MSTIFIRLGEVAPCPDLHDSVEEIPNDFNELADEVQTKPEGNDHLNRENDQEKQIFGGREILENFVCLLQKTSAHRRGIHPKGIVGFIALRGNLFGHRIHLLYVTNVNIITSESSQSTKKIPRSFPKIDLDQAGEVLYGAAPNRFWSMMK